MNKSRKPTHRVVVQRYADKLWHPIGVAWFDADTGNLAIRFNPFAALDRIDPKDKVRCFVNGLVNPRAHNEEPPDWEFDGIPENLINVPERDFEED